MLRMRLQFQIKTFTVNSLYHDKKMVEINILLQKIQVILKKPKTCCAV